eukprot:CAMPEP_0174366616 /NCGR_PEP_ID=MMETSP0811_2-20130205/81904_1 /TAXON_ID=73025 ORGANISM="Eutreptiella gymnastica-like, Strain CCMP1594" /NCGR_SAMPLE_ID=MMETSP0811_2 /ASSEMBLY_ACC=CAM_ASM_000667 /LENGTH=129 /DNA_ID=CAMNT_0015508353 /DNA_START=1633 /DNA_END=2022 /DNA_ORIENTATION=+
MGRGVGIETWMQAGRATDVGTAEPGCSLHACTGGPALSAVWVRRGVELCLHGNGRAHAQGNGGNAPSDRLGGPASTCPRGACVCVGAEAALRFRGHTGSWSRSTQNPMSSAGSRHKSSGHGGGSPGNRA